jgi:uncharacterized protein YndB with AHSA1/START domain
MLTSPEFGEKYWRGARPEAEWRKGGKWRLVLPDGRLCDRGEIVEFEPARLLAIRWHHELMEEMKAEGWSLCRMEIEPQEGAVKLTITHSIEVEGSKFIAAVSGGWPQMMSNLKSLIETGQVVLGPMDFD